MKRPSTWTLRRLAEPSLALALYSAAALVVTHPLLPNLGRRFLGSERSDLWFHVWGYWWMKESLLRYHQLPLHTELINYPFGGVLFNIDPLGSLLSIPLQLLFGLTAAYNLVAFFNMLLAATAAYYLIRYLLARGAPDRPALLCLPALVGGAVFGFSPHLLGEIENGITETFHVGWIAVYALLLFKTFDERRAALAVGMGLTLFVAFFANTYYGIFCVLLSVLLLIQRLITDRKAILSKRFALALGISVVCFLAPAVPYALVFSAAHDSPDSLVQRNPEPPALDHLVRNKAFITEAYSFFRPWGHGEDRSRTEGDHFTNITYLGYLSLLLSLLGAAFARARPGRHLWTASFGIFFVLSMGPVLVLDGQVTTLGEDSFLTLPFYHLFTRVPYLCLVSHPYRVTVMTMLALAVLCGFGVDQLLRWLPWRPLGVAVALLLSAAVVAETVMVSPVVHPMSQKDGQVPRYYHQLGAAAARGALINVPMSFCGTNQRRIYYYYQTVHRRPLPFVIEKTITHYLKTNGFTAQIYHLEWRSDKHTLRPYYGYKETPDDLAARARAGILDLKKRGFQYVVLDRRFFLPSQRRGITPIKRYLDTYLGKPKPYDTFLLVYTIP